MVSPGICPVMLPDLTCRIPGFSLVRVIFRLPASFGTTETGKFKDFFTVTSSTGSFSPSPLIREKTFGSSAA